MTKIIKAVAALVIGTLTIAASPYTEMAHREIKALSPDRINSLRNGTGAGYALAAELNGYPGPRHVLDLADKLKLTNEQRRATALLFEKMNAEAVSLGRRLIEQEAALDALFRNGEVAEAELFRQTAIIGNTEAKLRATHLKYHLAMTKMLTGQQRKRYSILRGYDDSHSHGGHGQ